jgi:molecular chaperone GrpE
MSESAPPPEPGDTADGATQAVSAPAVDQLLADFRAWLTSRPALPCEPILPEPSLDVASLLAPFVALRHEVNLQTKASRAQLEQNAQALDQLRQTLDALRRPPPAAPATDDLLRPVLKTLIDMHDALTLGHREAKRLRDGLPDLASVALQPPPVEIRLPWWARWLGLQSKVDHALASLREAQTCTPQLDDSARLRQQVDAMLVGYEMSLQRLQRALEQNGLERIACRGQPFDPETMEVAEVLRDPARGGTEVIDEVRPGYRWRGKLLRYAQVRVARP